MLVAFHLEAIVEELGYVPVGVAADMAQAQALAGAKPDIALVDVNLRDGPTGPEIGRYFGDQGVSVVFVSANPDQVQPPIPGALGVVAKPCDDRCLAGALDYVSQRRAGHLPPPPPALRVF